MSDYATAQALLPGLPGKTAPSKKDSEDFLVTARARFDLASTYEAEYRRLALDDMQFYDGDQWPPGIETQRKLDHRPCITINRLPQFVHQVSNNLKQLKAAPKVSPVDAQGDQKTAEVLQGLLRHIETQSNADAARSYAAFYAAVAMEGARPTPHVIEAIEQNGTAIYRYQTPSTWLGSGDRVSFYQLKSILQGVVARGTAASMARLSPYVAGKTGTSDDENDAWFIGFTNEVTIGVWVGYDNADGRRRTLGPGMTGGKVALPIFEPIVEAVWRDYARRTVLSPPSSLAARQMAAVPIDLGSGEPLQPGTPGAFTEYLRLDAARQLVDSRYSIVSRNEAFWARSYDPGSDGDLYGPYASRTGGGYYYGDNAPPIYGPQSPYPSQGGGSMFSNRGPFGGIFGDQRYFEQREYNRQQQRRVDPDYFINRFQTN